VFRIVNEQTHGPVESPVQRVLAEGRIVGRANHTLLVARDGTERPIDDSGAPIRCKEGKVVGCVLVFRDVTARRTAETEHRRAEERLRSVLNTVVDGIVTVDEEGRIQTFNPAAERLFGFTRAEVIGQNIKALMPEPYRSGHDDYIANHLRTGVAKVIGVGREVVGRRKDGSTFPMALAVSEFVLDGRRYFTGSVHDVTERKQAEAELREADRRKDEFLATLAHELRNPLAPIRNAIQILMAKGPPDPELRFSREVIDRQVRHMARLLDDLLDVSRITHGKLELRKERIELAAVVRSAVETSQPLIDGGGLELSVTLPEQPVYLDADPVRLAQVLSNLLNNSARYSEPGVTSGSPASSVGASSGWR
jgi:PAS domain S-box-containing protein